MKRLGVLCVVLALVGCSRISLEAARYTCSPNGAGDQCPGGWRCINEGFCVDPAVGEPWKCGDSFDCTGGWKCILDGRCVNPDAGGAWTCAQTSDCTGGWHCGVGQRCYDLTTAGNVTCRADAGDCAPSWVCGLEGRCLDTSLANGNVCLTDVDCFAGQRCSLERCIDVQQDALRPSTGTLTLTANAMPFSDAGLIAAWDLNPRVVAAVVNDELWWLTSMPGASVDGGPGPQHRSLPPVAPKDLTLILDTELEAVLVQDDGGLLVATFDGGPMVPLVAPAAISGARTTSRQLLVFGPDVIGAGLPSAMHYVAPPVGMGVPHDVTQLDGTLVVAAEGGVFGRKLTAAGFEDGGWRPAMCDARGAPLLDAFTLRVGRFWPLTVLQRSDGGTRATHFERNTAYDGGCGLLLDSPFQFAALTPLSGDDQYPRVATPQGAFGDRLDPFIAAAGLDPSGRPVLEALDGGASQPFALFGRTNSGGLVTLDDRGRVAVEDRAVPSVAPSLVPMMPNAAPNRGLTSTAMSVTFHSQPGFASSGTAITCFSNRLATWCSRDAASVSVRPVRGSPDWISLTTNQPPFAAWTTTDLADVAFSTFVTPAAVTVSPSATADRDGGVLVVQALDDYLVWAEVSPGRGAVNSQNAVSPLPRGVLADVVLTNRPPTSDARFAEGWALASGRVFRFFASTRALWRSAEVVLPTEAEVVRLWLDGSRPRAGDLNGVVFGLDSAVALSEPLLLGEPAEFYASWCEHTFVSTRLGHLYRLGSGPGVLGRWQLVATPEPIRALSDEGQVLRAFSETGRTYFFDGLSCTPN